MVTMLSSLAAAPANDERTAMAQRMVFTDAEMMGITLNMMLNYMQNMSYLLKKSPILKPQLSLCQLK